MTRDGGREERRDGREGGREGKKGREIKETGQPPPSKKGGEKKGSYLKEITEKEEI